MRRNKKRRKKTHRNKGTEKKLKIFRKNEEKMLDISREIDYYIQALQDKEKE